MTVAKAITAVPVLTVAALIAAGAGALWGIPTSGRVVGITASLLVAIGRIEEGGVEWVSGFQKRVRILPGVTLNFSKSGVSTSFGVRGARITKGHGKTRVTVGLPGSGLSYTQQVQNKQIARSRAQPGFENGQPKKPVRALEEFCLFPLASHFSSC